MGKPYLTRHTAEQFTYEQTERFLRGEWVAFLSDWAREARWLADREVLEVGFKNGHVEAYPADRPTALGFAFAPSKGGFLWDRFLQHKRKKR